MFGIVPKEVRPYNLVFRISGCTAMYHGNALMDIFYGLGLLLLTLPACCYLISQCGDKLLN